MSTPVKFSEQALKDAIMTRLKAVLVEAEECSLLVGIPKDAKGEESKSNKAHGRVTYKSVQGGGMNIADYAYQNEFGVKSKNIPPRPFMRSTFKGERLKAIAKAGAKIFNEIAKANRAAREGLEKWGLYIAGQIKQNITHGHFKENRPYTLAHKKGDKPLIDTGAMRASLTAWVTSKKSNV